MKTRKRKMREEKSPGVNATASKKKKLKKEAAVETTSKTSKGKKKFVGKTKTPVMQKSETKRKTVVLSPSPVSSKHKKLKPKKKGKMKQAKVAQVNKPGVKMSIVLNTSQPVITHPQKEQLLKPGKTISLKKVTLDKWTSTNPWPLNTSDDTHKQIVVPSNSARAAQNAEAEPSPDMLPAQVKEKSHAETGDDAEEAVTEHNYSKDPKDALMKLNLPIYACTVCKNYTYDPQQATVHSREVHNAKVGILYMLPFQEMKTPQKTENRAINLMPNPGIMKPTDGQKSSRDTSSKQQPLKLNELANVEGRARSEKKNFECEKCQRHFDRERQMSMHKCIQVTSKRQSPRRGDDGDRQSQEPLRSPGKPAADKGEGTSSSSRSEQPEEPRIPITEQPSRGIRMEVKRDTELLKSYKDYKKIIEDVTAKSKAKKIQQTTLRQHSLTEGKDGCDIEMGAEGEMSDEGDNTEGDVEDDLADIEVDDDLVEMRGASAYECASKSDREHWGVDEMTKQWENRGPPTPEELNKFIKTVQGGLQSVSGPPLEFFMCLICRKVFKTKNVLRPHLYSHLGYRPFSCTTCGFSATHRHALKLHQRRHVGDYLKCWHSSCMFTARDEEDLTKHRILHIQCLKCELCNGSFISQSTLVGHLCIKHAEEIKEGEGKKFYMRMVVTGRRSSQIVLFECEICGLKSKTKRAYYSHLKVHSGMESGKDDPLSPQPSGRRGKPSLGRKGRLSDPSRPEPIKCPMCETRVLSENALKKHMSIHPFVYRCSMCENKFLTYGSLNEHVGSHRNEVSDFSPQEKINESLRMSMYLGGGMDKALEADKVQWAQRRTGERAPKSSITGSLFDELMSKINLPAEDVTAGELEGLGKPFTSMVYKRLTPSILRYIHMRFGNVECGVCGKLFPKVGLCKDHTKKHSQIKEFKCSKCPFQVGLKALLSRHMIVFHGEGENYFCEICDTDISSKETKDMHMKRHAQDDGGPFTCSWCNNVEEKREVMKNHIMDTHPLMPKSESAKILGTGVVIHRQKGSPFLVCEVCSETFRRICDLRRHMWKHSAVKRFTCDQCDYGSDKRTNIITHMRKHSDDRSHVCGFCGKGYKTDQTLKLHVRTSHLKIKPFKCELCDYAAAQPVHLRRHKFLHHNEGETKLFKCTICLDYRASDLQVIKRHYLKKHPTEHLNLSKCCPAGFRSPSLARKDKHQVIQVVPSLPAAAAAPESTENANSAKDQEVTAEPEQVAEAVLTEQPEQVIESSVDSGDDVIGDVVTIDDQHHQITEGMTVQVVLPEDQAQLLDINSTLPDVINALAALQDSDFNHQ